MCFWGNLTLDILSERMELSYKNDIFELILKMNLQRFPKIPRIFGYDEKRK